MSNKKPPQKCNLYLYDKTYTDTGHKYSLVRPLLFFICHSFQCMHLIYSFDCVNSLFVILLFSFETFFGRKKTSPLCFVK